MATAKVELRQGPQSLQCQCWPAPVAAAPPPWYCSSALPLQAEQFAAVAAYPILQPPSPSA